jgi:hypothetical protein
LVSTFEEWYS